MPNPTSSLLLNSCEVYTLPAQTFAPCISGEVYVAEGWMPKGGEMAVERVEVRWGAKKVRRVDGGRM